MHSFQDRILCSVLEVPPTQNKIPAFLLRVCCSLCWRLVFGFLSAVDPFSHQASPPLYLSNPRIALLSMFEPELLISGFCNHAVYSYVPLVLSGLLKTSQADVLIDKGYFLVIVQ